MCKVCVVLVLVVFVAQCFPQPDRFPRMTLWYLPKTTQS